MATRQTTSNDLIVRVDEEPDGEGWFECRICGVNPGFADREAALEEADLHTTFDCVEELA